MSGQERSNDARSTRRVCAVLYGMHLRGRETIVGERETATVKDCYNTCAELRLHQVVCCAPYWAHAEERHLESLVGATEIETCVAERMTVSCLLDTALFCMRLGGVETTVRDRMIETRVRQGMIEPRVLNIDFPMRVRRIAGRTRGRYIWKQSRGGQTRIEPLDGKNYRSTHARRVAFARRCIVCTWGAYMCNQG